MKRIMIVISSLYPVNYVIEENRDIIEYIKRDILFVAL